MMFLEWLGIFVVSGSLITVLRKTSAPFWTIGVVILVGVCLFFVLPTVTSVTTDSF
jgi:uncharacterized membrane protein